MIRSIALVFAIITLGAAPYAQPLAAEDLRASPAEAMVLASNGFTRRLFAHLGEGEGNLFLSPYSVHSAMQLVREGARGETAAEMDRALWLTGMQRGRAYRDLRQALAAPDVSVGFGKKRKRVPAYTLSIANALWGQTGYAFQKPYLDSLAGVYGAPLSRVDFAKPSIARKAINDWVAKQTRDRIQDIVPEGLPSPSTRIALANAIYLKTPWATPFRAKRTKEADFTGADGKKTKAKLMQRVGQFRYAEVEGAQVLELPYRGGHLSMIVYLPATHDGLAALEKKFVKARLESEGPRSMRQVDVKLPKFKVTSFFDLTPVLPKMGMPRAFDAKRADFTGMTKAEPLHIGVVLHKAFVTVDEAGTEAAAATVVTMRTGSARPPQQAVDFRADRPFLFEIRHRSTGAILFAGRVARP